jgi:replication-associated recombination protein RarA
MLHETHRPTEWSQVIGQPKVVSVCRKLAADGNVGGHAFWITGESGTGKSTIARLLAAEIASEEWGAVVELDAGQLTVERVRELASDLQFFAGGKGGRAVIVNEAHGLRAASVRALLVALEPIPAHVCWIFTTTVEGNETLLDGQMDAGPLQSRCLPLSLARRGLAQAFADKALEVGTSMGLAFTPEWYLRLVKDCRNNLRAVWSRIEVEAACAGVEEVA